MLMLEKHFAKAPVVLLLLVAAFALIKQEIATVSFHASSRRFVIFVPASFSSHLFTPDSPYRYR